VPIDRDTTTPEQLLERYYKRRWIDLEEEKKFAHLIHNATEAAT
jgi:hypothetical protein